MYIKLTTSKMALKRWRNIKSNKSLFWKSESYEEATGSKKEGKYCQKWLKLKGMGWFLKRWGECNTCISSKNELFLVFSDYPSYCLKNMKATNKQTEGGGGRKNTNRTVLC